MAEKKVAKYGADGPEGQDHVISELCNIIEEGQIFKNRRKKGVQATPTAPGDMQNLFMEPQPLKGIQRRMSVADKLAMNIPLPEALKA